MVVFPDGTSGSPRRSGVIHVSEIALLIVDVKGLNLGAAAWGDSSALEPGDWVLAVGAAADSGPPSLSAGIFSARRAGSARASGRRMA